MKESLTKNTVCKICGATDEPMKSGIIDGEYISGRCRICFGLSKQTRNPSALLAQYKRERDREDNSKDIVQPFMKNKPNREFIKAYPDKAKELYTDKELKDNC